MSEDERQKRWTPEVHAQGEKRFDLKSMHVSDTKNWVQGRQSQTKLQVDRQRRETGVKVETKRRSDSARLSAEVEVCNQST